MAACFVFRREISRTAFWDFCNTIGGKPDGRRTRPESYLSGTVDGWVAAATTLLLALGQSEVRVAQGDGDLLLVKLSLFPVFNEGVKYTLSDVASVAKVQIWQVVDRF